MNKVEEEIIGFSKRVNADLLALDTVEGEYKAAVREVYVRTLDIEQAMAHRKSLKAAAEAFRAAEAARQEDQETPAKEDVQPVSAPADPEPEAQQTDRIYRLRLEFHLTMIQANALKKFLADNNIETEHASITMVPENTIKLTGEDAEKMERFVDALDELDDVQDVYHNAELPEEEE